MSRRFSVMKGSRLTDLDEMDASELTGAKILELVNDQEMYTGMKGHGILDKMSIPDAVIEFNNTGMCHLS